MEIVRINFNYDNPEIVGAAGLQSKKDRYYFKDSIGLNAGEVYISPLDLNMEFGEIEQPLKPMIRFSTPVVDNNGITQGIIVLNYLGPDLLDNFTNQVSISNKNRPMLLNSDAENRKLYAAIQHSPSLISIADIDSNIEFINPKFTELSGYSKEEVIGENPRILQSKTHSDQFYKELWDTISTDHAWRGELLNKKKNGEFFWEAASISPILKKGKITSYIKVAEDFTERKHAEEELQVGRDRLKILNQIIRHDLANEFVVIKSAARIF